MGKINSRREEEGQESDRGRVIIMGLISAVSLIESGKPPLLARRVVDKRESC